MPNYDFYFGVAGVSILFLLIFAIATYHQTKYNTDEGLANEVLETMPFITQSIGIMWPLVGFLVLCSSIFQGVAESQGVVVEEAPVFIRSVLTYAGLLTVVFASPILGVLTGKLAIYLKRAQEAEA